MAGGAQYVDTALGTAEDLASGLPDVGPISQFPPSRVGLAECWARPVWGIHHGAPGVQRFFGAHSHLVVHMATRTMVANKQTLKGEDGGSW